MAVNDVYEIDVRFSNVVAAGSLHHILHYRQTTYDGSSSDITMLTECLNAVRDELIANYLPLLATDFNFAEISGFILNKPLIGTNVLVNSPGTAVGDYLPVRVAPVIQKITGLRGRSYRGRIYGLAPMEAAQNGGGFTTPARAAWLACWTALMSVQDFLGSNVWRMTVYSPTLSTPPTTILDNVVTTVTVNQIFGSVRGRQESR